MKILPLVALMAVPSLAAAGPLPRTLDALFDGGAKVEHLVVPRFSPRGLVLPPERPSQALIRVAVEVRVLPVSDFDRQAQVLDAALESLRRDHGFIRDMSFEPRVAEAGASGGLRPSTPAPKALVYEARGFLPEESLKSLSDDKAVQKAWKDASEGPVTDSQALLLGLISADAEALLSVPGVAAVGLGWDCMVKGPHMHIRPHAAAVVVEAARSADPTEVRARLLASLPKLAETPFVVAPRPDPVPSF